MVDKIGIRKRLAKSSQMFKRRLSWLACNITSPVNVNHMRSERAGILFPNHERLAAAEAELLARRLGLSATEAARLHFIVANHGLAHEYPYLPHAERERLTHPAFWHSLALLQAADAYSCWCPGGGHLPIHWELFERDALAQTEPPSAARHASAHYFLGGTLHAELHAL